MAYCDSNFGDVAVVTVRFGVCRMRETATNGAIRRISRPGLRRTLLDLRLCRVRKSETRFDNRNDRSPQVIRRSRCAGGYDWNSAFALNKGCATMVGRSTRCSAGARSSRDAELPFLVGPPVRERAGERRNGEIGWSAAARDRLKNAWRYEGERRQISDMALDLVLLSRDRLEGLDTAFGEIVHPGACLGDRGQQRLDRLWIEIGLGRWLPGDALSRWRSSASTAIAAGSAPVRAHLKRPTLRFKPIGMGIRRAGPQRYVDVPRPQNDVVHVQRHKVAIGELRRRRWARDSRVDDPRDPMPDRGDDESSISGAGTRATLPASALRFCRSACET